MYKNVGTGVNFEKKRNLINELQEKKFSEEEILKIMSDKSIIHELEDENNNGLNFLTVREKGERVKEQYRKQRKNGILLGTLFLISTIIFSIIGIASQNYNVFYGVLLQLIACVMLLFQDIN